MGELTPRGLLFSFFSSIGRGKWCGRGWDYEGGNSKTSHTLGPMKKKRAKERERTKRKNTSEDIFYFLGCIAKDDYKNS